MPGTKAGGIQAGKTNRERYGDDWYNRIGALGGRKSRGGGFVGEDGRIRARVAGTIGGTISRRGAEKDDRPEVEKTCTFCLKTGHSAYTCRVRANVRKRKQLAVHRAAYMAEEHQEQRSRMSAIAKKWAKR